jgi:hypothetical protein
MHDEGKKCLTGRPPHGFEDAQPSIARLLMGRLSIQDGIAVGKGKSVFSALLVHGASVVDKGDELPSEADREVLCTATLSGLDQIDRFCKGLGRLGAFHTRE